MIVQEQTDEQKGGEAAQAASPLSQALRRRKKPPHVQDVVAMEEVEVEQDADRPSAKRQAKEDNVVCIDLSQESDEERASLSQGSSGGS